MKTKYLLGQTWDKIDIDSQNRICDGDLQLVLNHCDKCLVIDYSDDLYWGTHKEYDALCDQCYEQERE